MSGFCAMSWCSAWPYSFSKTCNRCSTSSMIMELLSHWNLTDKLHAVTPDNAIDVHLDMKKLFGNLKILNHPWTLITDFRARCISHVVRLAVDNIFKDHHRHVSYLHSLLVILRCITKRRHIYEMTQNQIGNSTSFPHFDFPTRRSSNFDLNQNTSKASSVLDSMTARVPDLRAFAISKQFWKHSVKICTF